MIHLGDTGEAHHPVCAFVDSHMHDLKTTDGSDGKKVTCPRCLALMELHDE